MKNLPLILFVFLSFSVFGQSSKINGRITSSTTNKPIPYVNISIDNTNYGCSTNDNGYFSLIVPHLPVDVTISHIHYETKKIHVKTKKDLKDIELSPNIFLLDEAVVKPIINITHGLLLDVLDYTFWENNILISGYCYKFSKKENPWLININSNGDTLSQQVVGNEGIFYTDCMGIVHYLTDKYAYQLQHEADSFIFTFPQKRQYFANVMNPCQFEMGNKLIVKTYSNLRKSIIYQAVDKDTRATKNISSAHDSIGINMLLGMGRFFNMGDAPTEADIRFEQMAFLKPIYSPIFKIKDSIYFFNLTNDKLQCFDQNFNLIREDSCLVHHSKHFKKQIIIDEPAGRAFALFRKTGISYIQEIDLSNGKMLDSYYIPNYPWVDKIKVYNNQLFFLYREKYSGDLTSLYRMKLD